MELIYDEEPMSLYYQIQVGFHAFFCQNCAQKIENYQAVRLTMKEDFLPSSPDIENSIMEKIAVEEIQTEIEHSYASPGVLSTRGWVIAGLIIMVSLITAFFGLDFQNLASESGMSFMLPVGITIGIMLTAYGVFFIGSNLKELSERFGL